MTRRYLLVVAGLLGLSVATAAQNPAPPTIAQATAKSDAVIRAALSRVIPGVEVSGIRPSPIAGYREVAVDGHVVYVSIDGKYLVQGSLIQLDTRENLTETSAALLRRGVLAGVGADRRIIFSPPSPKYRVTVFTDIDCGYCRKLHTQIADYNKAGISVEYLFFPRAGIGSESYNKAVNVWCAADRQQALTDAKLNKPVPKKTCPNPIAMEYNLGQRVGVDGTPALYAADGSQLGGYLSPKDLLAKLDKRAAKTPATR